MCRVCQFSSSDSPSYYRSRGVCTRCVGDAENSKVFYAIIISVAMVVFCCCIAVYLRDDFGAIIRSARCGGRRLRRKSTAGASGTKGSSTAVVPVGTPAGKSPGAKISRRRVDMSRLSVEKFKIILTYVQILALFRSNYSIRWPGAVRALYRLLLSFNLDLLQLVAVDCLYRSTYYFGLVSSLCIPLIASLVIGIIKKAGVPIYERKLKRVPRKCVRTGKPVTNWMKAAEFRQLRAKVTADALASSGWEKPTPAQIKSELAETAPLLKASRGIKYVNQPRILSDTELDQVIKHNMSIFKLRTFIRINHLLYNAKTVRMFFILLLVVYPSVALRITRVFKCDEIGRVKVLGTDLYTECALMQAGKDYVPHADYITFTVVAAFGFAIYVVGIPTFFFTLLWLARRNGIKWKWEACQKNFHRKRLLLAEARMDCNIRQMYWHPPSNAKEERKAVQRYLASKNFRDHRVKSRLGFIYSRYKESCWWYEIVELARKFFLNCAVSLITPGESSQIVAGIGLCLFFLVFLVTMRPYRLRSDMLLAASTHASLLVTLILGLMINLQVHYLGEYTFNDAGQRDHVEMALIEALVIAQCAGVGLQFLIGVVLEVTCSNERVDAEAMERKRDMLLRKSVAKVRADEAQMSAAQNSAGTGGASAEFWGLKSQKPTQSGNREMKTDQELEEHDLDHMFDKLIGHHLNEGEMDLDTLNAVDAPVQQATAASTKETATRMPSSDALVSLFRDYDMDHSGGIDTEELANMVHEMSMISQTREAPTISEEDSKLHASTIMSALDTDGNGTLEEAEFVEWIKAGLSRPESVRQLDAQGNAKLQQLERFLTTVQKLALEVDVSKDFVMPASTSPTPVASTTVTGKKKGKAKAGKKSTAKKGLARTPTEVMF